MLPLIVGALAVVGDSWVPVGDWASAVLRTGEVGSRATPLVGAYSTKGFAHPGPLPFWVAAPLYRLTGGDPRALLWTAATINVASIVGVAAVAWRRGGWPLLVGAMVLVGLVVHGIGVWRLVDMWNPFAPLLPFMLTVFLVLDAGLGRSRALVEAAVPASFAAQSHLAFVSLLLILLVWLVLWRRFGVPGQEGSEGSGGSDDEPWRRRVAQASAIVAVLWVAPVLDALFDLHNPVQIVDTLSDGENMGISYAFGLLSRYVRPDGPWIGGPEPEVLASVQGTGVAWLFVVVALLVACLVWGRRQSWSDVVAWSSLTLTLLVGAIPAIGQFEFPANAWLTQWIKVVGGLAWFTIAWTVWRTVEPAVAGSRLRRLAPVAAGLALVVASASSWRIAAGVDPPQAYGGTHLAALQRDLEGELSHDVTYRLEERGDVGRQMVGVMAWLADEGYRVRTSDGADSLKWGRAHRWLPGDGFDVALTLAVHQPGVADDPVAACRSSSGVELLAEVDDMTRADRARLDALRFRRVTSPTSTSPSDIRRAARLEAKNFRVALFATPADDPGDNDNDNGNGPTPGC